jgi:hypothetical protein
MTADYTDQGEKPGPMMLHPCPKCGALIHFACFVCYTYFASETP